MTSQNARVAESPSGHLSDAQILERIRAACDAMDYFEGKGRYAGLMPMCSADQLRKVSLRFHSNYCLSKGANGITELFGDGSIAITLRLDIEPDEIRRVLAHELQHVADAAYIRAGYPSEWFEARARDAADRLPSW